MSKTLVIVESPGKVKKLSAILGAGYTIEASRGHVRDLPERAMGVGAAPAFAPNYEATERGRERIAKLKKAVSEAGTVLLATDPDREGEAIAWHLAEALRLKKPQRITFNEITTAAVKAAVTRTREIKMPLVRAQEARRVLDRLVGYTVSPLLSRRAGERLSAGRVQSPAVRLVVDREREIAAFKPTNHFGVELTFDAAETAWTAVWDSKPWLKDGEEYFIDKATAERIAALREVYVREVEESDSRVAPKAPFITSTLQQDAGRRLRMKPKATMEAAQRLYEQGVITYHRTDYPNLSDEGCDDIEHYARAQGLPIADKRRKWKAKDGAQEAHEAIRPTHIEQKEAGETDDERRLYDLIWRRALASQLADAVYDVRTAKLDAVGAIDGRYPVFIARGRTLREQGWRVVYDDAAGEDQDDSQSKEAEQGANNPVPPMAAHSGSAPPLVASDGALKSKVTKAPARYTEANLVKKLEELGIGRPATYAAILDNITSRGYVVADKKDYLHPGPPGEKIVDSLCGMCQFVEYDYTRELEEDLDRIAEGQSGYEQVVGRAFARLTDELSGMESDIADAHACPDCGKQLRRLKSSLKGKPGFFWGCTGYPDCKTTRPDADGKPGERVAAAAKPEPSAEHSCGACNKPLVRRTKKGTGGWDFWACSGFPACKQTYKPGADGAPIKT